MLDDTLVVNSVELISELPSSVSILIVLDDTLVLDHGDKVTLACNNVSILIVLDDTLVHIPNFPDWRCEPCLNPYCAGRYSSTSKAYIDYVLSFRSLNPYCAGRYSSTISKNYISDFPNWSQSLLCWTIL